ncbi:hypothetical protein LIQ46_00205 [Megasphaera elsdenii]|uniref:hypothetical protein n=1 Tax=Megasphaera elsdenii TaxID=907 RepID=UPI001D014283|nr:hypothetical protein [Megasphaera elsdenii]MCB5701419.1 hypothetical protein [Megasphaera elsdenii]MCB5726178.1 hypothetical protein [Megasphaera elsdenii]MCB5770099.1 hypothetical protein [Megasphaera elsdenii]
MKTSESKIRANTRYNKKAYDQLAIRLPKGERERFAAYAEGKGLSLAEYVRRACYEFSGKGFVSVAYAGWSVSVSGGWIVAERIDNSEEEWLAAPATASRLAKLAEIAKEWSETSSTRTELALEALKEWNPIRHTARPGFTSYRDEDGTAYFEDEICRFKTKELVTTYLVGADEGEYYYFRDGLGADPVDLLDFVVCEPEPQK